MDVIVTLPKRYGLKHLQEKIAAISSPTWGEAWWDFRRFPKKLEPFDRVFIVCEGMIRGSFEAHYPDPETGRVYFQNWKPIEPPLPMKGFPGFRYVYWKLDWERILKDHKKDRE